MLLFTPREFLDVVMQMSSNRLFNSQKFNRLVMVVLAVWIASAAFGIYLLTRFDTLVHGELYNFGLEFDPAWASSYYSYMQLMCIALGVPIALSVFSILIGFKRETGKAPEPGPKQELKPKLTQPQPQPVVCEERKAKITEANSSMVISCPSCKKVFSRPLVMLNFEGGKTKLVNVCPYCNNVLGSAENEQAPKSDFQIADEDKKLTH
jgi:uncharacterized Zn-finger protein